jgi:transposase
MGQATRTTRLLLDLGKREEGGANSGKRAYLEATRTILNQARTFYLDFFLAHSEKEHARFVRLKVYTGTSWQWCNYPIKHSRYVQQRLTDPAWEKQSPKLIVRKSSAELHFSQTKEVMAKKIVESKQDPDLVTVAVDLNVKMLAVITVRQGEKIRETVFVRDQGLDQARYRHLKRIAKKQWQSGKPVKGEHSNQQLWGHVRRMNRKQANQLRGKINQYAREKAYALGVVTVETNPHGTGQYCSRCGARGERFSNLNGTRVTLIWGKLFRCPVCHYEAQADFNASCNVHHSFYGEYHWQPHLKRSG